MVTLKLYTTPDTPNTINKKKEQELTLTGTIKDDTNILNPTITIKRAEIFNYNYAYIPDFNRYYFISNIALNNAFLELTLDVDVIESFKTDILRDKQIIGRQENAFNNNIVDNDFIISNKKFTQIINFPNSEFNTSGKQPASGYYYTLTVGNVQNTYTAE